MANKHITVVKMSDVTINPPRKRGPMIRFLVLSLFASVIIALEDSAIAVPDWVRAGILRVESGSYYKDDGVIKYINKKRGRHGERGCFQITKGAFNTVKKSGEQFWMIEQDTLLCEDVAWRYLVWLYQHDAKHSWSLAVEKYNAGPRGRSADYLSDVKDAAYKEGYAFTP